MSKTRFADVRKLSPALAIGLYAAICLGAAWRIVSAAWSPDLLFILLGLTLYAVFFQPGWVVGLQLAVWLVTISLTGALVTAELPTALLNYGLPALICALTLAIVYHSYWRNRRALGKLDERFSLLAQNAAGLEYWQRPDGSLGYISAASVNITGYSAAELTRKPDLLQQMVLPEDLPKLAIQAQPVNGQREIRREEVRIRDRSGQLRWLEYSAREIFDQTGQYLGRSVSMVDISPRKKETENLKIQFERLHTALETSEDGVWDLNLTDGIMYFNPRYATLMGLKPGENHLSLKDYRELIHPDDQTAMLDAFKAHILRQTTSYESEYRLLTRFGKWRWVLDRGRIMTQDAQGKPTRMVGTHIDITERKVIQEALQQSEEKFRQLAENMREVFWLRDKESGRFIYISPAFNEIWGHSADEMYEDPNLFLDSIHWEDFSRVYHGLRELVTNGVILNEEYRILQADGSIRWVLSRAYPIRDGGGDFYRIAGIVEDITERKEIEMALRKSENRYRDLIERQGDGVSILDEGMNIIYMNPAGEDIFGGERGSLVNRNLREFMSDEQFAAFLGQINHHREDTENSFEVRITRENLSQRSLLVTTTPRLDMNGQYAGEIAIFKDITQRKEKENRLWYLGMHDGLTGLFNRAHFDMEVERLETSDTFPIGIIMVDVDNLKQVNDQYGHAAGDDLLLLIAKLLKNSVRSGDIVARIGGDEFAILMPASDENTLTHVLSRIDANIRLENEKAGRRQAISVSAGGSTAREPDTLRANIEKADAHMYETKNRKKKQYAFNFPDKEE
jgi:diguanylate cyclase (GGDEF)-like protein/PAS domain S-box-containing protein